MCAESTTVRYILPEKQSGETSHFMITTYLFAASDHTHPIGTVSDSKNVSKTHTEVGYEDTE